MSLIMGALQGIWALLRDSGRVLVRVGPILLAIYLVGATLRAGTLWLAVLASGFWPFLGVLLVPLAPLAPLASLVFMLRTAGRELPAFADASPLPARDRLRQDFLTSAIVLIPFLAVYASQGMLKQDITVYIHDVTATESARFIDADYGRAVYDLNWVVVTIIVTAIAARQLIKRFELVNKHWAWALAAAYLEALWLVTFAHVLASQAQAIVDWVTTRQIVASVVDYWEQWVATLGALKGLVQAIPTFFGGLTGMVVKVVTMPVAWLAVGAMVFGRKLVGPKPEDLTPEAIARRTRAMPKPIKKGVDLIVSPISSPILNGWIAVKKVAVAGVGTMILFCIAFYLAIRAQSLVSALFRLALGPQPPLVGFVFEPYANLLSGTVYWVLTVALLVAAVNTVATAQARDAAQPVVNSAA